MEDVPFDLFQFIPEKKLEYVLLGKVFSRITKHSVNL